MHLLTRPLPSIVKCMSIHVATHRKVQGVQFPCKPKHLINVELSPVNPAAVCRSVQSIQRLQSQTRFSRYPNRLSSRTEANRTLRTIDPRTIHWKNPKPLQFRSYLIRHIKPPKEGVDWMLCFCFAHLKMQMRPSTAPGVSRPPNRITLDKTEGSFGTLIYAKPLLGILLLQRILLKHRREALQVGVDCCQALGIR